MGEDRELGMPWNQLVLAHMHSCCMDLFPMLHLVSLCWFLEISHGEVFTPQKLANVYIRALSPRVLFAKHLPIHCWQLVNNNTINIIALWENFKLIQSLITTGIERREISLCVCVCVCVCVYPSHLPPKEAFMEKQRAWIGHCSGKNTPKFKSAACAFMVCTFFCHPRKNFRFTKYSIFF